MKQGRKQRQRSAKESAVSRAVGILVRGLDSPDELARIRAADAILAHAFGGTEERDVLPRLAAIEERLRADGGGAAAGRPRSKPRSPSCDAGPCCWPRPAGRSTGCSMARRKPAYPRP